MIQNLFELWYWIVVLAIMAGVILYFAACYARDLWTSLADRWNDKRPTVFAEKITEPYSKRMVMIHWLTLALLFIAWYLGDTLVDARTEKSATMTGYLVHALIGGAVLVATVIRTVYRSMDGTPQPASNSLMDTLAKEIHRGLYLLLLLIPLTGFMTLLTSDVGLALVTVDARYLPEKFTGPSALSQETHDILMTTLMVVVAIHILGVIWHQFIRKDNLMMRMLPRGKERPAKPVQVMKVN